MREQSKNPDPHESARRLEELLTGTAAETTHPVELDQLLRQAVQQKRAQTPTPEANRTHPDCPSADVWAAFVAGQREAETDLLLSYAAACSECAARLRTAMNAHAAVQTKPRRLSFFSRPLGLALAAGLLVAIGAGSFALWRQQHNDDALLARAYDQQRLTELRIPGGHNVPLATFTRGETTARGTATTRDPADLSELNTRITRRLEATPNDAGAHQMLGRIDLLRADPLMALGDFKQAQDSAAEARQPLPDIESDLAAAWFELGEQSGKSTDYAEAANLFTLALNHHPADAAVVLYNRALCFERQGLDDAAIADLRDALAAETATEWRSAIQARLDKLKPPHANAGAQSGVKPPLDFETALAVAFVTLPSWDSSATSRATFAHTAADGLTHNDHWLADWIAGPHNASSKLADQQLADAAKATRSGHYSDLLADVTQAVALYAQAGNHAGALRAQQMQVFALQRVGRAADCRSGAERLLRQPVFANYPVLVGLLLFDEAGCAGRLQDFAASSAATQRAMAISTQNGLPYAHIRAEGTQAELLAFTGDTSAAWRQTVAALRLCHVAVCNSIQVYQLLSNVADLAQQNGHEPLAAVILRSAVASAPSSTPMQHAYAVESLATLEGIAGDNTGSARDFTQAITLASTAGNHLPPLYKALWQTDQAQVLTLQGHTEEALHLLSESTSILLAMDYAPGRVQAFSQLARTQLSAGRTAEALNNAQQAVHEAERALPSLHTLFDREQWVRENADVYAGLVDAELRGGNNDAALRDWEHFRAMPWTAQAAATTPASTSATTASAAPPADHVLVIARIHDHYIGWLARPYPLTAERTVVLGDREQVQAWVTTFQRLCSEPASNLAEVHAAGALLYRNLLAPLDSGSPPAQSLNGQQQQPHHLWLDLDPSLQDLPLGALTLPSGAWLANEADLTELAPSWSAAAPASLQEEQLTPSLNAVLLNGFSGSEAGLSEAPDVARLFAHARVVNSAGSQSGLLSTLSSAQLLHFSGHAQSGDAPALQLQNTALTPELLAHLPLHACRIAVLAACSTGAEGNAVLDPPVGLRNALLDAGVHTVVVSSWDVENASTRQLMLALYGAAAPGVSVSHALRLAEQNISSTPQWQHPFYWAAFQSVTQ